MIDVAWVVCMILGAWALGLFMYAVLQSIIGVAAFYGALRERRRLAEREISRALLRLGVLSVRTGAGRRLVKGPIGGQLAEDITGTARRLIASARSTLTSAKWVAARDVDAATHMIEAATVVLDSVSSILAFRDEDIPRILRDGARTMQAAVAERHRALVDRLSDMERRGVPVAAEIDLARRSANGIQAYALLCDCDPEAAIRAAPAQYLRLLAIDGHAQVRETVWNAVLKNGAAFDETASSVRQTLQQVAAFAADPAFAGTERAMRIESDLSRLQSTVDMLTARMARARADVHPTPRMHDAPGEDLPRLMQARQESALALAVARELLQDAGRTQALCGPYLSLKGKFDS